MPRTDANVWNVERPGVDPDWRRLGDVAASVCLDVARRRCAGYAFLMFGDAVNNGCMVTPERPPDGRK